MTVDKRTLARRIDQALGREPADLVLAGGRFLNVVTGEIAPGDIAICGDTIVGTYEEYEGRTRIDARGLVAVPGFVDAHVHVESSLITPTEFDRCVLPRGTTTAICDPHEIANVLGLPGLSWFLESARHLAMDLRVQLSSCVPATALETGGATLRAADLLSLAGHPSAGGLAEMMNFPGLLRREDDVLEKLVAFQDRTLDGHCPLVRGRELNAYAACGIRNCHESVHLDEAREKLRKGMQVLLRDGSVSKDVARLASLLTDATSPFVGLCTDDRNPLDIDEEGHMDHLVRTAIAAGAPVSAAYRAASWSAARGFRLDDRGLLAPGQRADVVLVSDLPACAVERVISRGRPVDEALFAGIEALPAPGRRSIHLDPVTPSVFRIPARSGASPVIGVVPGSIVTDALREEIPPVAGERRADPGRGLHKLTVLARHGVNRNVARAFVRGFGFPAGALASSVGHDSHNVIVVGADDVDMAAAVNHLIRLEGGFVAVVNGRVVGALPLPVAGLLSDRPFDEVRDGLRALRAAVRAMGCPLAEPFLQLAFLALPVIPHLKLTDRGLVDVDRFELVPA